MSAGNDAPSSPDQRRGARALLIALITLSFLFIATYALRLGERQRLEQEIAAATARLQAAEERNARLEAQAGAAGGAAQIDELAREVLQMGKPGEVPYVGVEPPPIPAPAAVETAPPPPPPDPVWRQWLEFFAPQLNYPAP